MSRAFAEVPLPAKQAGAERSRRWCSIGGTLLIFVAVSAAYWPIFRGQFVWDDALVIKKNPLVTGHLGLASVWFGTDFPLTMVVFWVEWLVWGNNPAGYHVINVLLHSLSAVLVWRVLLRLNVKGAWLAALLFALHPVCVASAAWISELKNTLSLPFLLLSLLWYLRFDEESCQVFTSETGRRITTHYSYLLSLGAFIFALLSKTTTVMLPVVLLVCAWWRRGRIRREDWLSVSPFFALALAFGLSTVWFQRRYAIGTEVVQTENFWGRLAGAGMAIWFYLGKALLPVRLNLIYPRWHIDASSAFSYVPLLLVGLVAAVGWKFRSSWGRPVLMALICFCALLLPVLGFVNMYFLKISRVSDHFQYLAIIAVLALVGASMTRLLGRNRVALLAASAGLAIVLGSVTFERARVMANAETLWRDTLARNPAAWLAHNNLGCILAQEQKIGPAKEHFIAALELYSGNAAAHANLGKALALEGRLPEAEAQFRDALAIKPQDPDAQRAFGLALAQQGRNDEALLHLRWALSLEPDNDTRLRIAQVYGAMGKPAEALAQLRQALASNPNLVEALNNAAWLLATVPDEAVRNGPEAVRLAQRGCQLTGYKVPVLLGTLAAAYASAGDFTNAVATGEKAGSLARAGGDERFASINDQLLQLYRTGQAYHTPR